METRTETRNTATEKTGWDGARFLDNGISGAIGFLGISGSGKTYNMGRRVLRKVKRAVVFNTVAAYGVGPRQNALPGFGLVGTPSELLRYIGSRVNAGVMRVIYQPMGGYSTVDHYGHQLSGMDAHFYDVASLLWEMRDVTFAIDEVWRFQTPAWSPEPLQNMALMGRIRGITLAWTSQRPQPVDKALLRQSTELYIGQLVSEDDIAKIQREFPLPSDAAAAIRNVQKWEMVHVKNDKTWRLERP